MGVFGWINNQWQKFKKNRKEKQAKRSAMVEEKASKWADQVLDECQQRREDELEFHRENPNVTYFNWDGMAAAVSNRPTVSIPVLNYAALDIAGKTTKSTPKVASFSSKRLDPPFGRQEQRDVGWGEVTQRLTALRSDPWQIDVDRRLQRLREENEDEALERRLANLRDNSWERELEERLRALREDSPRDDSPQVDDDIALPDLPAF